VHHPIGDLPGSRWLVIRIAENVVHSWDLATAIGVNPELDEQLVEIAYGYFAQRAQGGALYATGWIAAPPVKNKPASDNVNKTKNYKKVVRGSLHTFRGFPVRVPASAGAAASMTRCGLAR